MNHTIAITVLVLLFVFMFMFVLVLVFLLAFVVMQAQGLQQRCSLHLALISL